jgi:hypothetical protein
MSACVGNEHTLFIVDALAVFHALMSSLNVVWLADSEAMLVTAAVFQPPMLPYVVVAELGLVIHVVTAVPIFVFVMAVTVELHMLTTLKRRLRIGSSIHIGISVRMFRTKAQAARGLCRCARKRIVQLGLRVCGYGAHVRAWVDVSQQ